MVFSSCESEADARRIAAHLVERRLAACVNIVPGLESVYRWKGAVTSAGEFMLIIKSRASLVPAIEQEFKTVHPYEVPELVVLPLAGGGQQYMAWLDAELQ